MEFVISKGHVKYFVKTLQCMSKVGEEMAMEYSGTKGILIYTLNKGQNCFLSFTFDPSFFEKVYRLAAGIRKVTINLKMMLSLFRSQATIEQVLFKTDSSKLYINILGAFGIQKNYTLNTDATHLSTAQYELSGIVKLTSDPSILTEMLDNYQNTVKEISFVLEPNAEELKVMTYIDPEDEKTNFSNLLMTNSKIALKEFQAVEPENFQRSDRIQQTFNLKQAKAFSTFCQFGGQTIDIYIRKQGNPIIFWSNSPSGNGYDVSCVMVLATVNSRTEVEEYSSTGTPSQTSQQASNSQVRRAAAIQTPSSGSLANKNSPMNVSSFATPGSSRRGGSSGEPSTGKKRGRAPKQAVNPSPEQEYAHPYEEFEHEGPHISPPSNHEQAPADPNAEMNYGEEYQGEEGEYNHEQFAEPQEHQAPPADEQMNADDMPAEEILESPSPPSKKQRLESIFDMPGADEDEE